MVATSRFFVPAGTRYHRIVVLENERRMQPRPSEVAAGRPGARALLVRCDCGKEWLVSVGNFRHGQTKSCGCWASDRMAAGTVQATHNYSKHQSFDRWVGMVARCENPRHKSYPDYGARGIAVCSAWHDPKVFCDWLDANLGSCPPGWSIDRINNDGDYEPGNVRWASPSEQAFNRRKRRGQNGSRAA